MAIITSAKRRSGKSYLCREICHQIGQVMKFDCAVLFSETADFNDDFDFVSKYFKYNHFDEEILDKFLKQQEQTMKHYKQMKRKNKNYNKTPPRLLFIFDDVAHDKKVFNSKAIAKLFVMGRHIMCSVIVLTQWLTAFSPKVRANSDLIITFRDPDFNLRKYLQDSFMTLDINKRRDCQCYMDKCFGEAYRAMVVCVYRIQSSMKLSDYIGYYKASQNPPKFKLGQKEFWDKGFALKSKKSKETRGLKVENEDLPRF